MFLFRKGGTGFSIHLNAFPVLLESLDKKQSQRSYLLSGINKHVIKSVS